jgi:hypothetical protein
VVAEDGDQRMTLWSGEERREREREEEEVEDERACGQTPVSMPPLAATNRIYGCGLRRS